MSAGARARGHATVEYVGLVAIVAVVIGGLLVLSPRDPGRRAPVRPLPAILKLIERPAAPVVRRPGRPGTPRRPRRSPPRDPAVVHLPRWLLGR